MGLCLRDMADPQALVLGVGQHQGPITGAGPTGRALHHMPGVARGHGTLKAARPEAWQWGGHMEGRVGRAEGLAKEGEPGNLHLAPRTLLVVQSSARHLPSTLPGFSLHSLPCRLPGAPFAGWVLGHLACPPHLRLGLCSSQVYKKGTQAHSRASGMFLDGASK